MLENINAPNVNRNPLLDHAGAKVNAMETGQKVLVKRSVRIVCTPMKIVYETWIKAGMMEKKQEKIKEIKKERECYCLYHEGSLGHSIQGC